MDLTCADQRGTFGVRIQYQSGLSRSSPGNIALVGIPLFTSRHASAAFDAFTLGALAHCRLPPHISLIWNPGHGDLITSSATATTYFLSSTPARILHHAMILRFTSREGQFRLTVEPTTTFPEILPQIAEKLPKDVNLQSVSVSNKPHGGDARIISELTGVSFQKVGLS